MKRYMIRSWPRAVILKGLKKAIFFWAIEIGLKYEPYGANGWFYGQKLKLARKLIFSKWQEALGGNLELMVSGSAALQPRLTRIFAAAGMPIMEGYGLTETSPVISVNDQRDHGFRIGTVGKIIDNVEVKDCRRWGNIGKRSQRNAGVLQRPGKNSHRS